MSNISENKLNDLEIKIAEQEKTIQELSDMVTEQWDKIDLLTRKIERTNDRVVSLEDNQPEGSAVEKPPHY